MSATTKDILALVREANRLAADGGTDTERVAHERRKRALLRQLRQERAQVHEYGRIHGRREVIAELTERESYRSSSPSTSNGSSAPRGCPRGALSTCVVWVLF